VSADDAQAREVEVRLVGEAIEDAAMRLKGRDLGTVHRDQIAREALDAIEHIREAERQEAAREGERRAMLGAVDELCTEIRWQAEQHHRGDQTLTRLGCIERLDVVREILRNRADGVTGRSEA
jgi:hypothetical protein